jgi:HSP20 family molecular chaperone IbpA
MAKRTGISVADFERAFDEFFDEMLISRWRRAAEHDEFVMRRAAEHDEFENAQVFDHPDRYEVRIAVPNVDPERIEIDVAGQRLSVRAPTGSEGIFETAYSFAVPIEAETVQARWIDHVLIVIAPKQKPKRIKVDN